MMVSLIRDMDDGSQSRGSNVWVWVVGVLLAGLVIASAVFAVINASQLGWPAFILLAGMAMVSAFGAMSLISSHKNTRILDRRFADRDTPYSDAFFKNPEACVIVRDGKVFHANQAYLDLARRVGAMGISGTAPSVDRLFGGNGKDTASAIFRLHHIREDTAEAEEFIDTLDAEGHLRRYRVHVSNLGSAQLWQVSDVTKVRYGEEDLLIGAPVGLFSVTREGNIIATNAVLDRWLGGERCRKLARKPAHTGSGRTYRYAAHYT